MTINEARLIREIKKRCTYRRLAEIYFSKEDLGYGVQGYGEDLCKEALLTLYPDKYEYYWKYSYILKEDEQFKEDNKSHIGDFFWWE